MLLSFVGFQVKPINIYVTCNNSAVILDFLNFAR